ncbi:MAG: NAD(P)H-hydrate epimerase, partial [Candidatus Dadabacteria bacterium]
MDAIPALLPSSDEMRAFDNATISGGVPSLTLMERAGESVFSVIVSEFGELLQRDSSITVLCGSGNNGGDGLVVARHLLQNGFSVKVAIVDAKRYSGDFVEQYKRLLALMEECEERPEETVFVCSDNGSSPLLKEAKVISWEQFSDIVRASDIVVDALLGTGITSAPRGPMANMITALLSAQQGGSKLKVCSVDVPSGINVDTGEAYNPSVRADLTVTIQLAKRGLFQSPAFERVGVLRCVDIGIKTDGRCEFSLLDSRILSLIRERRRDLHKGASGRVLVVGGSIHFPGASALAGYSALRAGSGLVRVCLPKLLTSQLYSPELIPVWLEGVDDGSYGDADIKALSPHIRDCDCLVVGPGLGQGEGVASFVD